MLSVRVVGGLALEVDGAERAVPPGRPARLALAWLALHPGLHARSRVAGALWPDVREDSARASLRNALTAARRALGDDGARHLVATRDRVGLGPAEEVEVDVRRAAALAASGRYPEAAALLDGDLLPGLDADWVHDAREGHRAARAEVLAAEAAAAEAAGDAAEAIRATRALVALDPLAEASHRELIRRLTVAGDRAAARAAYDRLRDLLRDRLGVAPTRETRALLEAPTPPATDAGAGGGPGLPEPLRRRPRSPLVAREREQAALRRAWAEAAEGGPRVAVLAGEPGVGKTRLASDLARRAHAAGATVLLGRAREDAPAPHGVLAEALRPLVASRPAAALGPLAGELARLVPDLAARLPRPVAGDPDGAGFRLAEAVTGALAAACADGPALLLVDDAQWMDAGSASLLAHAVGALGGRPLLVLLTRRDDAAPPPAAAGLLAAARADGSLTAIALAPVDEAATAAIVEGWAGPGAPAALVRALHERTGGNPFCVEETLRELEESGVLGRGAWPAGDALGLPAGVREAVTRRLDRLGADERWLLRLAAVMGSAVTADGLEACARAARAAGAAPVEPALALDALERATAARLTREAAADGGFDFAHALVRETLVAELSAARLARMHVAVAEAIDGTGADAAPVAAYHLVAAGAEADPELAADAACSAAEQAMARAAYAQAAEHLERTLAIPGLDGDRRGDLLVRLGHARARAGAGDAARVAFDGAAALARAAGDGVLLARAAIGAGGLGVVVAGEDPARSALLREAIATLGDGEPALRARLMARLATERHYAPGGDRLALSAEAVGLGRASGDPEALLEALVARRIGIWDPDHLDERTVTARELIASARALGDLERELQGHHWLVVDLLEAADVRGAEQELTAHEELADALCLPAYRWYGPIWRGLIAVLRGDPAAGARLAARGAELGEAAGDANATFFAFMNAITARFIAGRTAEEDVAAIEHYVATSPVGLAYRSMLSWVLAARGEASTARAHLAIVARHGFADLPRDVNWMSAMHEAGEAALILGDEAVMADVERLSAPFGGRLVLSGRAACCYGLVDTMLGRLAARLGRPADADARFDAAEATAARGGLTPLGAMARAARAATAGPAAAR